MGLPFALVTAFASSSLTALRLCRTLGSHPIKMVLGVGLTFLLVTAFASSSLTALRLCRTLGSHPIKMVLGVGFEPTRDLTPTRPSTLRVYQFHHPSKGFKSGGGRYSATEKRSSGKSENFPLKPCLIDGAVRFDSDSRRRCVRQNDSRWSCFRHRGVRHLSGGAVCGAVRRAVQQRALLGAFCISVPCR